MYFRVIIFSSKLSFPAAENSLTESFERGFRRRLQEELIFEKISGEVVMRRSSLIVEKTRYFPQLIIKSRERRLGCPAKFVPPPIIRLECKQRLRQLYANTLLLAFR